MPDEILASFQSLKQAMRFLDEIAKEKRLEPQGKGAHGLIYLVDGLELTIVRNPRAQWCWQVVKRGKEENPG